METEFLNLNCPPAQIKEKIEHAAQAIREGKLVVFPTETVYGLGADGTNAEAASKIYAAKGRPSDNPLIIHISSPEDAEKYAYVSDLYYRLADRFMPGPLTVVLPAKDSVPKTTRGGLSTVAIRCPSHPIANLLIALSGVPIAAPSANLSGSPSPTCARHVMEDMKGRVDIVIDGGDCSFGLESTIVKPENDGSVTLLRPGKITVEDLLCVAPRVNIADAVTEQLKPGEVALSPGMKYRHYAPKAPLSLLDGTLLQMLEYILESEIANKKIGILSYSEDVDTVKVKCPFAKVYDFGSREDTLTQAHLLFYILREADKEDFDQIYAPLPPKEGIGLALYNRMIRAAAHHIVDLSQKIQPGE